MSALFCSNTETSSLWPLSQAQCRRARPCQGKHSKQLLGVTIRHEQKTKNKMLKIRFNTQKSKILTKQSWPNKLHITVQNTDLWTAELFSVYFYKYIYKYLGEFCVRVCV